MQNAAINEQNRLDANDTSNTIDKDDDGDVLYNPMSFTISMTDNIVYDFGSNVSKMADPLLLSDVTTNVMTSTIVPGAAVAAITTDKVLLSSLDASNTKTDENNKTPDIDNATGSD